MGAMKKLYYDKHLTRREESHGSDSGLMAKLRDAVRESLEAEPERPAGAKERRTD